MNPNGTIAVVFDCDDTLWSNYEKYAKAKDEFAYLMLKLAIHQNLNGLSTVAPPLKTEIIDFFTKIDILRVKTFKLSRNRFMESMLIHYSMFCGQYNLEWDCGVEQKIKEIAEQIWGMPNVFHETKEVLQSLATNPKYTLYALSAGDQDSQMDKFKSLKDAGCDLTGYFQKIIIVPYKDNEVFQKFTKDHPDHSKYIMVGDSLTLDICPATNAGFDDVIWLNKGTHWLAGQPLPQVPDTVIIKNYLFQAHQYIVEKYNKEE